MTERTVMNCKRARLHIALSAGGDLDEDGENTMNAHLVTCPPCLQHRQAMLSNLRPLHDPDEAAVYTPHDSLWPDLLARLPARTGFSLLNYNGWWVALTVMAACVAIAMFWQQEAEENREHNPGLADAVTAPANPPDYFYQQAPFGFIQKRSAPPRKLADPSERLFVLPDSGLLLRVIPDRDTTVPQPTIRP